MGHTETLGDTDIVPTTLDRDTTEYISWFGVAEDFNLGSEPKKRERLLNNIQDFFGPEFSELDITDRVSRDDENNLINIPVGDEKYYFDIYSEAYAGNSITSAKEYVAENPPEELQIISQGVEILYQLLHTNAESGWRNSFLEEDDIVPADSHEIFGGMNAKELQMTIRQNMEIFENKGGLLAVNSEQRNGIIPSITTYLEMIMGIGEIFEEAVGELYKTEAEIDRFIGITVDAQRDFEACNDYYKKIQTDIYNNSRTSTKNKKAHEMFSAKLGAKIFERFKREYSEERDSEKKQILAEQGIHFAEIITERIISIDNSLRNPHLAEEICIFILSTHGGIFDTLENCTGYSLDFVDEKVGDTSPGEIVENTKARLEEIGISPADIFLNQSMKISLVSALGIDDIGSDYHSLSLTHKREISILVRFLEKLSSDEYSLENLRNISPEQLTQKVTNSSEEIYHEAIDAVRDAYDKNFDTSFRGYLPTVDIMSARLQDIGIGAAQLEAFELFNDIRGNDGGVSHDYTDENLTMASGISSSVGIIAANIIIVMAATAITGGVAIPALVPALITSGGTLSATGSLLSIGVGASIGTAANIGILDPRRHDSRGEMYSDLASDFAINTFHAVYMERLTMQLWGKLQTGGRAGLISGDFGSGIGIEVVRDGYIRNIYGGNPMMLHHKQDEFGDYFHQTPEMLENIPDDLQNRFLHATNIYHAWNFGELVPYEQIEFQGINFENIDDVIVAIDLWCERQEEIGV